MSKIEDIKCFCLHIKATSFYKNTSGWLLLKQLYHHQFQGSKKVNKTHLILVRDLRKSIKNSE